MKSRKENSSSQLFLTDFFLLLLLLLFLLLLLWFHFGGTTDVTRFTLDIHTEDSTDLLVRATDFNHYRRRHGNTRDGQVPDNGAH